MSYCLNPLCPNPCDPLNMQLNICRSCGSKILLQDRYRVIRPLSRGGFGQTFEVDDCGQLKVLKLLHVVGFNDGNKDKVVDLFQQEAAVLSRLHHPGIPRGDGLSFCFWPKDSPEPLHCLVMEKIDGLNLKQWLESRSHKPITQEQAIAWLKQLLEILFQVHQYNYFHRDIKPSNIMLRTPSHQGGETKERLVLIDFGAVREATETYLQKLASRSGTAIISPGYTPPEQINGRAVAASDFYAIGRTFVHLLTGIHPLDFSEDCQTGQLIWRNSAPQVSQELADLIDDLMAPLPPFSTNRPRNAQEILQRIEEIENPSKGNHWRTTLPPHIPLTSPSRIHCFTKSHLRNRRLKLTLVVSVILLFLTGARLYFWLPSTACDSKLSDHFSCGQKILLPDSGVSLKQKGVENFARGNLSQAINFLEKARNEQPRDPETLIYLNNARLANQKAYTIAVVAPIGKNSDTSLEILRGVAQAQDEINREQKRIKGFGLRVLIADDANNYNQAQEIAKELVIKEDILAVIGHYTSEVTLAALPIYQQHQLVLISPGSTSEELSRWGDLPKHIFFRTVPNSQVVAQYAASYMIAQAHQQTAAIFYSPASSFSRSLRNQFLNSFRASGGKVVKEFDLSNPLFNSASAIDQAQKQGATAFGLFPDGGTTSYGVPNALKLVKANQGRYWIVGDSTLYSPDTLELLGKDALNRFVVVVAWDHLDSYLNSKFPQIARDLWGGDVSWRTATTYDAARALIAALEKLSSPSRVSLQQVLADNNFHAEGATGAISFRGGDRNEPFSTLVKVVPSNCSSESYEFVPVTYPPDSLKRCQKEK